MTAGSAGEEAGTLTVKQAAHRLGVHYMTAYRYVRQGRLPARRRGTTWAIRDRDVEAFATDRLDAAYGPDGVDWSSRLRPSLVAGDERAAWWVVEASLAAGVSPPRCCTEVIGPAVAAVGEAWAAGTASVADQHLASAVAERLVVRLGSRFRPAGQTRGTVVVGAPPGEHHALAPRILANVVRWQRFAVLELGTDVPPEAFVVATGRASRCLAVALSLTRVAHLPAAADVCREVAAAGVAVVLGGQAVRNPEVAAVAGASHWAPSAPALVEVLEDLVGRSGPAGPGPGPA